MKYAIALLVTLGLVGAASANLSFTEDFSGALMPANMETTGGFNAGTTPPIAFGGTALFTGTFDDQRQYLRTVESDYYAQDFTMEVSYFMNGGGWWEAAWIGMGTGTTDGPFNSPGGDWIGVEFSGDGGANGVWLKDGGWAAGPGAPMWDVDTSLSVNGAATHRFQFTYTAAIQNMSVAIDFDYAGGAFVADATSVWTTSSDGNNADENQFNASNSHLFMGTAGNGSYFDDLSVTVVPEPATLGLFGLLGGAMLWIRKRF